MYLSSNLKAFFIIQALKDVVQVIGLTRETDTRVHHAENLTRGEIVIAQFSEHTAAPKKVGEFSFNPVMEKFQMRLSETEGSLYQSCVVNVV